MHRAALAAYPGGVPPAASPLAGVRVLDLTRVASGPAGRRGGDSAAVPAELLEIGADEAARLEADGVLHADPAGEPQ